MKDRIAQIIQKEGLTAGQFAEKIGTSPASLSHILKGRNNPSLELVMKIHKACDYINLNWLLYGEGEMEADIDTFNHLGPESEETEDGLLTSESAVFPSEGMSRTEYRKENEVKAPLYIPKEIVREEVKYIEKPTKKITEIRIFYDNGTYEILKPGF